VQQLSKAFFEDGELLPQAEKIHKNACCFCSPECRTAYFKKTKFQAPSAEKSQAAVKAKTSGKSSFFGWLGKLLND